MIFLAFDTSTERGAIGLLVRSGLVLASSTETARHHGRDLIPRLAAILREAGKSVRDVDAFAVGLGPGSYTGLRVGVTAAKTLAYATGAALIGLDSLEATGPHNASDDASAISVIADAPSAGRSTSPNTPVDSTRPFFARTRPCQIEPLRARHCSTWSPGRWCWDQVWIHPASEPRSPPGSIFLIPRSIIPWVIGWSNWPAIPGPPAGATIPGCSNRSIFARAPPRNNGIRATRPD